MSADNETQESELIAVARNAIAEFNPFEKQLAEFRERYDGVVYDLDNEAQNKQARSDRYAIGKVIARLDNQHKAVKEPLLEATRLLDGRRKEIKDGLLDVQGAIKSQIDAHEAKEKARVEAHFQRIDGIRMAAGRYLEELTADHARAELERIKAIEIDDSFEEFKPDALLAKTETVESLERQLADREKYEAEQAELARLRAEKEARERAEREAKIAAEAAEKAKRKAEEAAKAEREKAERARVEAEDKAKQEIAEANARAQRAAMEERERILEEQREEKRKQDEANAKEAAKKAKQAHINKVHKEAAVSLLRRGVVNEAQAKQVVEIIAAGGMKHVQIVY